jgi:hypothetical protein
MFAGIPSPTPYESQSEPEHSSLATQAERAAERWLTG